MKEIYLKKLLLFVYGKTNEREERIFSPKNEQIILYEDNEMASSFFILFYFIFIFI